MATAVAPPVTPKTTTSVDPLYTVAVAQAKTALAGETAPITAEQNASDAAFQGRETDATGVAAALSKLLQPIGPAVNSMYQTAGQNQELAANGFSQGMQDALKGNTDNLNATLKSLGQNVTLDSHAAQAGDVLYGLGGYTPGTAFAKEGAAFGSAAELQAGDAILKGQDQVKSLKAQAIVADQGFQNKIAEMAGKLPGDIQTNYTKLHQLALDDAKFREQVAKDKVDAAYKSATLKLSTAKYNTSIDEFNAKQTLSYAKLAQSQYNANRDYSVKLANLGIAQKKLQLTITQNAFKAAHDGYTQKQLTKFEGQSLAMAQSSLHGSTSTTTTYDIHGNVIPAASRTRATGGMPYFQALTVQLKKGIPVQLALKALDQVYPASARPTDEAMQKYLGPLTPDAIRQQVQVNSGTLGAAQFNMASPTASLISGGKVGHVVIAPGADRSGVPTVPAVRGFAGAIAGALGAPVTIGTGSNHNEMTTDGNVSDHWTGHAADITTVGGHAFGGTGPGHVDPALTKAGQTALILAGMPPAQALQQNGGLFNLEVEGHRVQIIFNSFEGGNHYNHLHVGIK